MPGANQSLSGHQASAVTVPPGPTPTIPKGNTGLAAMAEARDPRREMQENGPSLPEGACQNGLEGYSCVKGNGIIMVMDTLTLEIPWEIAQAMRLPPQDQEDRLRLELAVALYSQSILGLGKAAELAQLTPLRFDEELGRRHIPMHYGDSEVAQDVAYGCGRQ